MYKIIGADGKEYGPISLEQLKQWLAEGRLNQDSKVQAEGETTWRSLRDLPEMASQWQTPPPPPSSFVATTPKLEAAERLVRGPAIFMIVLSVLNILTCLWGLIFGDVEAQLAEIPNIPKEYLEFLHRFAYLLGVPANIVGLTIALICLLGSIQMLKLRSYGLAMATAILMLIPCSNCCCCLNIGAGIWALVVLSKLEVKSSFH
jgi:hypothetical protein